MAKLKRFKDEPTGLEINLETGDVTKPEPKVWSVQTMASFARCVNLVDQIVANQLNIVDDTNVTTIAYSLVEFEEKGRSLFTQVCLFQHQYEVPFLNNLWQEALQKSKRKSSSFIKICKEKGLQAVISEDEAWTYILKEPGKSPRDISAELTEADSECIREYHHLEYDNCYYFARYERDELGNPRNCVLERKSNFVLQILYHIQRGKINKRVVVLKNNRKREVTLDIETDQITSFQKFKSVTEGAGNFLFEGTQVDLNKIKNKLFELEKPCVQIDTLGWHKKGSFFTFCNGIYNAQFRPVDKYGIVQYEECNYYIPYHPEGEESMFLNEKKFAFKDSAITWSQWAPMYYKAFGEAAMPCLVFAVATLYSDAIFAAKNNFPMLFLYGEGGSGKSTVVNFLQYLFGQPQPALKLSEKANTDKAKIRKLAQFANAIACMEEYINDLDLSVKKTLTGIYDRLGYERGTLDSKFGTETVPIQSTIIVTGNEYPDDDPLLQRLILIDYNHNVRTPEVTKNFDKLVQLNRQGITSVTGQLLQHRDSIIAKWDQVYRQEFINLKNAYTGPIVPDRMIENNAVLLAVYKILNEVGREWPFTYLQLRDFLIKTLISQADKRDTGAVLQRFWDIVLSLLNKKIIKNGREIKVDGNEVSIRFKEIHLLYLEEHNKIYRSKGLASNTILEKLKASRAFEQAKSNERFGEKVTSSYVFKYDELGVDFLSIINYQHQEAMRFAQREEKANSPTTATELNSENVKNNHFSMTHNQITEPSNSSDDLPF